ncbi:intraflagellar transport protein 52 homolog [Ranitomeya variabilis]|uniref:intraflagellar transport protein 52 homolog n=1 Tax=Ranitomeya variabilis TaxID=490064 RepID=UPI004056C776
MQCNKKQLTVVASDHENRTTILFNVSKNESGGYKALQKRLRATWKIQREINRAAGKNISAVADDEGEGNNSQGLTFVYPFGATLNIMKPAVAVLSTGSVCFPLNRAVMAFYYSKTLIRSCNLIPQ